MISLSGDEMVVISFKDGVHNEIDIKKNGKYALFLVGIGWRISTEWRGGKQYNQT